LARETNNGITRFAISTIYDTASMEDGCSISCNGVCLTVVERKKNQFSADVSEETLARTTLGSWQVGRQINLERALRIGDELGGHLVTGHIDSIGETKEINGSEFTFIAPDNLVPFIAEKGSITIDGVSLTVNLVQKNSFVVNIIPHTMEKTTFRGLAKGDMVNLEIDLIARYTASLLGK